MLPYVKTRFKITLTINTFKLLLEQEDVLYHKNICFVVCTNHIDLQFRRVIGPV